MKGFNDCKCKKCNRGFGWYGELSNPPPCPNCGHNNAYDDIEKKLDESRNALLEVLRLENLAGCEHSKGHTNTADKLFAKARALRKQYNIV